MDEYAEICLNLPKLAWIAFYVFVPILVFCLLERMANYFNEVYNVKERDYFIEENGGAWIVFNQSKEIRRISCREVG